MTLAEFKAKNPAYKDWPDDRLADGLYKKYYSSMSRAEFNQSIGHTPSSFLGGAGQRLHDMAIAPKAERDKTFGAAVRGGITGIPQEIGKEAWGNLEQAWKDSPTSRAGIINFFTSPMMPGSKAVMDLAGAAASPVSGTLTSAVGRPVEEQTGIRRELTGQALTMALPFAGKKIPRFGRVAEAVKGAPPEEPPPGGSAPTFKTTPGAIAAEHAAEVSSLEAQGTAAAAKKTGVKVEGVDGRDAARSVSATKPGVLKGEPGPILEQPKPGEPLYKQAWRWDDAANRLTTNDEGSKMEVTNWAKSLDPKFRNPIIWQRVSDEIEQRLVDPKAKLSPEAQEAFDQIAPFEKRAREAGQFIADWKAHVHGDEPQDLKGPEDGYVHRIAQGFGDIRDEDDPAASWQRDPIMSTTGGRSLSKFAPSVDTSRKFFVIEGKDGTRVFDKTGERRVVGEQVRDDGGRVVGTAKMATMKEIEANTGVKYHKNFAANTVMNMLRNERVANNLRVLDGILTELRDKGQVWRGRWKVGQNADGTERWAKANSEKPEGYIETKIPELRGHFFPPDKAKLLDAVFRGDEEPFEAIAKVNRVLNGSLFWQPFAHQMNVLSDFSLNRGWAWATPTGYYRLAVSAGRALRALTTQNADYVRFMREGGSLHYPSIENKNFYEVLLKKFGETVQQNPTHFDEMAKSMGLKGAADLAKALGAGVKAEYRLSSKMMWGLDDFLKMTRYYEEMMRGKPIRQAIFDTEKDMASYRVVPQIMKGQNVKQIFKSPLLLSFGRYSYAKARSISLIMRDLAKGTKQERVEASGKLAVIGAMYFLVGPLMNAGARFVTGNKQATMPSRGAAAIPQRAANYVTGADKDDYAWQKWIDEVINLSPAIERTTEFLTNRYFGTGQTVVEPKSTPAGKAAQRAEWAAHFVGPTGTIADTMKPGGTKRAIARQFGISSPPAKSARAAKMERGRVRGREKRDPVKKMIQDGLKSLGF